MVWQKAMDFVAVVYEMTESFPTTEQYGLVSQLRRAAVSIPSNIAEGVARSSAIDYARFLNMAIGSTSEIDTQIELSERLGFLPSRQALVLQENLDEINRMLIALRKSIRKRIPTK